MVTDIRLLKMESHSLASYLPKDARNMHIGLTVEELFLIQFGYVILGVFFFLGIGLGLKGLTAERCFFSLHVCKC